MNIQHFKIDPSLKDFAPTFVYDEQSGIQRLILTNYDLFEEYNMKVESIKIWTDKDNFDAYEGVECPWKIELCANCDGIGSHLNSSMRNHAYTSEDFAEDPDLFYDMRKGKYDQTCKACNGNGRYITITHVQDELNKILNDHYQAEREYRDEIEQERRMGC